MAQDPLTRILLTLVLVLLVACMLFGMFGLLTSKAGLFKFGASADVGTVAVSGVTG